MSVFPTTDNVWLRETTSEALRAHFEERVSESSARGRDGLTPQMFEATNDVVEFQRISDSLEQERYRFSNYLLELKLKGRQRLPREISIPTVRDRIVLRALAATLKRLAPSSSIALPQTMVRNVIDTLSEGSYRYFLKLDVQDFYPSINHEWLHAILTDKFGSTRFARMLMNAVSTPSFLPSQSSDGTRNERGVPQGLAISNGLAELAIEHVDEEMISNGGIKYFRYVDDILIFMETDSGVALTKRIQELLAPVGLTLHKLEANSHDKSSSGFLHEGFEFLGYRFLWPRVSVRKGSIAKLEGRIARVFTRFKYAAQKYPHSGRWREKCLARLEWHLNLVISGCVVEGRRYGWLAYFSQIRHQQLLRHLDFLVEKQMTRHKISEFRPKTFVRSYRFVASRRPDTAGFVPNFDVIEEEEQRDLLSRVFGFDETYVKDRSDREINEIFRRKVKLVASDLERDINSAY